nr:D-tyrosyl-tRNA(Tyr) deacylase [Cryptococcus depauperatus CBS 7841]
MKAVLQRVVNASVAGKLDQCCWWYHAHLTCDIAVDGETISSINKGLLILVGIDRYDEPSDATQIIKKILTAKLWEDEDGGGWKKNVKDIDGEVLCVSQFTLLATFKGSKPDFHESMSTVPGKALYSSFLEEIKQAYHPLKIKDGRFGANMQVSLTNDGPVTILLSSKDKNSRTPTPSQTPTSSGLRKVKNKGQGYPNGVARHNKNGEGSKKVFEAGNQTVGQDALEKLDTQLEERVKELQLEEKAERSSA